MTRTGNQGSNDTTTGHYRGFRGISYNNNDLDIVLDQNFLLLPPLNHSQLQRTPSTCTSRAMTRRLSPKKHVQSVTSDYPWRSDNPFGPPQIPRSFPSGIKRLRNTLSKLAPSAFAEKELLRTKNHHRVPLTERNVDTLVNEQECDEAYRPNLHSPTIQVTEWLRRVS